MTRLQSLFSISGQLLVLLAISYNGICQKNESGFTSVEDALTYLKTNARFLDRKGPNTDQHDYSCTTWVGAKVDANFLYVRNCVNQSFLREQEGETYWKRDTLCSKTKYNLLRLYYVELNYAGPTGSSCHNSPKKDAFSLRIMFRTQSIIYYSNGKKSNTYGEMFWIENETEARKLFDCFSAIKEYNDK